MANKTMSSKDERTTTAGVPGTSEPAKLSRRSLLKAGTTAMPAILTLQSGSALARSSNLISAAAPDTRDTYGRTMCLDTDSVRPATRDSGVYDVGDPAFARVTVIRDKEFFAKESTQNRNRWGTAWGSDQETDDDQMQRVSEGEMCLRGGTYYTKTFAGWREVSLPQNGIVVSATALSSFSGRIRAKYI